MLRITVTNLSPLVLEGQEVQVVPVWINEYSAFIFYCDAVKSLLWIYWLKASLGVLPEVLQIQSRSASQILPNPYQPQENALSLLITIA